MARCMERGGTQWEVHDGCYGDGTLIFWFFGSCFTYIPLFGVSRFLLLTQIGLGLAWLS